MRSRIRVELISSRSETVPEHLQRIIFLLPKEEISVKETTVLICKTFGIDTNISNIALFLGGFALPENASSLIFRDMDLVHIIRKDDVDSITKHRLGDSANTSEKKRAGGRGKGRGRRRRRRRKRKSTSDVVVDPVISSVEPDITEVSPQLNASINADSIEFDATYDNSLNEMPVKVVSLDNSKSKNDKIDGQQKYLKPRNVRKKNESIYTRKKDQQEPIFYCHLHNGLGREYCSYGALPGDVIQYKLAFLDEKNFQPALSPLITGIVIKTEYEKKYEKSEIKEKSKIVSDEVCKCAQQILTINTSSEILDVVYANENYISISDAPEDVNTRGEIHTIPLKEMCNMYIFNFEFMFFFRSTFCT